MKLLGLPHADGTVVFGTDVKEFQNNLDMFNECSELWHLSTNFDKTKMMIFGTLQDQRFNFNPGGQKFCIYTDFRYLGVICSRNRLFHQTKKHNVEQARNAMHVPFETGRWDDIPLNERRCKQCTTDDIGNEYHYFFTCDFLRVTENFIGNRIFMLSQIYATLGSFLPQPMKQRSLNHQKLLPLLRKSLLCTLFFQMIETNYVPIYMSINYIFLVIQGQYPVTDYISKT